MVTPTPNTEKSPQSVALGWHHKTSGGLQFSASKARWVYFVPGTLLDSGTEIGRPYFKGDHLKAENGNKPTN